jgi:hypothetical protein
MTPAFLFIALTLTGPPPTASPSLRLIIHIDSQTRDGKIVQSELRRPHLDFAWPRTWISQYYRIEVKDDLLRKRPCYQIGTGSEREDFPSGAFAASGSFIKTLESIAAQDEYDRHEVNGNPWYFEDIFTNRRPRPKAFPPLVESPALPERGP